MSEFETDVEDILNHDYDYDADYKKRKEGQINTHTIHSRQEPHQ